MTDDPTDAVEHLVAHVLAVDHADCAPEVCEFVGTATFGMSEFDITAERIVDALRRAGWLRDHPDPFMLGAFR